MGGLRRLLKQIGLFRAKDLVLSGRMISAQEAFSMGLFNEVVTLDALSKKVLHTAQALHAHGPQVLGEMKKMMQEFTENHGVHFKMDAEVQIFAKLFEEFRKKVFAKKWGKIA